MENHQTTHAWLYFSFTVIFIIIIGMGAIAIMQLSADKPVSQTSDNLTQSPQRTSLPIKPVNSLPRRSQVENNADFSQGPLDAQVTVVEFLDFQCPYCLQSVPVIHELMDSYKGKSVRFMLRQLPITSLHPFAYTLASASLCAHEQKQFMPMHDLLFSKQSNLSQATPYEAASKLSLNLSKFNQCMANDTYRPIIVKDVSDAADLGIEGTPTWFFNGQKVQGYLTTEEMKSIIDQLLTAPSTPTAQPQTKPNNQ